MIHTSRSMVCTGAMGLVLCCVGQAHAQDTLTRFHQVHRAMGTEFALDLYAADQRSADQMANAAFDEVDRLDELLSNYRPSSELSRISRQAGDAAVTTDPETFEFLQRSTYWSRESGGAFDITVGPLLRAWGFFFHGGRIPPLVELSALRQRVGWSRMVLDPGLRTVRFTTTEPMELDPGSIGKGFAVDRVVALLRAQGVTRAFLSAGGSTLYAIGAPPGTKGWPVNVPDPRGNAAASALLLRDESLSTGACTEKFFVRNGHRYCHIFDPQTMRPVEGMLQATVIDRSATDSDALSTVAFVLGPRRAPGFFARHKGSRVLLYAGPEASSCLALDWPGNPCSSTSGRHSAAKDTHS